MKAITGIFATLLLMSGLIQAQDLRNELDSLKVVMNSDQAGVKVLIRINQIYYDLKKTDEALLYYDGIQKTYSGKELEAAGICLSTPILLRKGSYDEVKNKSLYVKDTFKGTNWSAESLYNLGELYLNVYEDKTTADKYFKELLADCPNPKSGLVRMAKNYLGGK